MIMNPLLPRPTLKGGSDKEGQHRLGNVVEVEAVRLPGALNGCCVVSQKNMSMAQLLQLEKSFEQHFQGTYHEFYCMPKIGKGRI